MKHITIAQVLQLHNKMIRETGGDDGIRDPVLLESALYNALSTVPIDNNLRGRQNDRFAYLRKVSQPSSTAQLTGCFA